METNATRPACPKCSGPIIRWGKDRNGHQRNRCAACSVTFAELPARPLGTMRIPFDRAMLCLNLLTEGSSIRATERITGTHRDTICRLLVFAGGKCEALLAEKVRGVKVENVQADEVWGFVEMKEKTRTQKGITDPKVGDAYTFVGFDRDSKLALAHHLGRRTNAHTDLFMEKLAKATEGHFQITTDGFGAYPEAVSFHLGERTDYATLVKEYGQESTVEQRRYSPPQIIGVEKTVIHGNPEEARICTSHVERQNGTIRTNMRRMVRLTCAFSKKWENLQAAMALHFAAYNFTRIHRSIRMTPAMKAGIARKPLTLAEVMAA